MRRIDSTTGFDADLEKLWDTDEEAAAIIVAVMEEADADPNIINKLITHGDAEVGIFRLGVKGWVEARSRGNNLLRFRVFDTAATSYRLIYGYDWNTRRIALLAIVEKNGNTYNLSKALGQRIVDEWQFATAGKPT